MRSEKCNRHSAILLCLLFIISACSPTTEQRNDAGSTACDTTILAPYTSLTQQASDPVQLANGIIAFYKSVPGNCRDAIVLRVIDDMFDLVYANPSTDTIVIPFLRRLADAQDIKLDHRTKSLLRIAAYHLYSERNLEKAYIYINRAKKENAGMNDTLAKTYYSLMGQAMMQESKLQEASEYYLKTIAICEKIKDSASLAGNYANYGTVFSRMGDHTRAITMRKKAVDYFAARNNENNLFIGYIGIGFDFGEMRNYDSSLHYYMKALDLSEKGVQNPNAEFDLLISMAGIFMGKNDYEKARFFYNKTRATLAKLNDEGHQKFYLMASTPAFAGVRNVDTEIAAIKSYIPGYFEQDDILSAKNAYYTLYHIYYLQDKNDLALKNYQTYDSLKSILAAQDNRQYIAELETKYNTQKKELKIEVQQKEIKQKNALNGLLLALLGAIVMASAFLITRYQLRKNKKHAAMQQQFTRQLMEQTEEERVRIARDLHDGVSQELLVLKHQIRNNHENTNEKIDFIINEIRMISRDLHPVMLDKIGLKSSVEHICEQVMETNHIFITSEIDYKNGLDKNGELQLFRMIQEALNNIVKYAGAEAAKVVINESEKLIYAEIMDNGKGFDVQEAMNSKHSFGLLSLTERSKALNGKTEISSGPSGTIVKIEIPKSHV